MPNSDSIFKVCCSCKESKSLTEFYKRASRPSGVTSQCKLCNNAATMAWKAANPDKVKAAAARATQTSTARGAVWREKNPDKVKAQHAKYRAANFEKLKAENAAWRKENKDSYKESCKKWAMANLEKSRGYSHTRRARISGAGGVISKGLADRLFDLQKGKCPCCNQPLGDGYQLDHITPIALGGANVDSNIQLLRAICNQQKSAKHPVDFMQQRGFLL